MTQNKICTYCGCLHTITDSSEVVCDAFLNIPKETPQPSLGEIYKDMTFKVKNIPKKGKYVKLSSQMSKAMKKRYNDARK